jgi:hypothetical protein
MKKELQELHSQHTEERSELMGEMKEHPSYTSSMEVLLVQFQEVSEIILSI